MEGKIMNVGEVKNLSYRIWVPDAPAAILKDATGRSLQYSQRSKVANFIMDAFVNKDVISNCEGTDVKIFNGYDALKQGFLSLGIFLKNKAKEIDAIFARTTDGAQRRELLKPLFQAIPEENTFTIDRTKDMAGILGERIFPEYGFTDTRVIVNA